jgi:SNF2 family DNA or RNA helicase
MILRFEDYHWPMKHDFMKPYDHQKETAKFFLLNKRAYCFSDLGVGKTLAALWAADFLMINKKIRKVLIISPLSTLQSVWGSEIFSALKTRSYAIAHGSSKLEAIQSNADFVIINHDGVVSMEDHIIKANFDVIIIDELTAFKKHTNTRSKAMIRIAKKAKVCWGLTGSPTPNSPVEAFGQARVVNPSNEYLPRFFGEFQRLVETPLTPYISIPNPGATALVNKILQPAIRFERDKCIDIPDCQYQTLIVPLSSEQTRAYASMKDQLIIEYKAGEITAANAAVKMMKLMQVASGQVKDDEGNIHVLDSSPRDEELWRIFEETGKTKLVVFSAFRASITHLVEFFRKRGVSAECIYGDVAQTKRAEHIRNFQDGALQVLVLQPQSTAHGITLTASNVIVWYSLVPSGEYHWQANGRITRAGQLRKQFIIYMIGTQVEKRVLSIVTNKGDMAKELLAMFVDL